MEKYHALLNDLQVDEMQLSGVDVRRLPLGSQKTERESICYISGSALRIMENGEWVEYVPLHHIDYDDAKLLAAQQRLRASQAHASTNGAEGSCADVVASQRRISATPPPTTLFSTENQHQLKLAIEPLVRSAPPLMTRKFTLRETNRERINE